MVTVAVSFAARAGSIGAGVFREIAGLVARGEGVRSLAMSFVLVDDEVIARMNRRFLGHSGATDVITFPLERGAQLEGEAYLSVDTARRNAARYGVPLREELVRLAAHAILHLCGYDDVDERSRAAMKAAEDRYVAAWRRGRLAAGPPDATRPRGPRRARGGRDGELT